MCVGRRSCLWSTSKLCANYKWQGEKNSFVWKYVWSRWPEISRTNGGFSGVHQILVHFVPKSWGSLRWGKRKKKFNQVGCDFPNLYAWGFNESILLNKLIPSQLWIWNSNSKDQIGKILVCLNRLFKNYFYHSYL